MAVDKGLLKSPRFILRAVELVFSIIVLGTAAGWIASYGGGTSNVNFALFVGLTSMLLCGMLMAMYLLSKASDRTFLLIELVLTSIYWVFWLAAACATASTTSWVNSWPDIDCEGLEQYLPYGCSYGNFNKGTVRACCAFCWLTWALWTGSLVMCVLEDVQKNKILSSTGGAAPAGAATAAPGANGMPTSTSAKQVDVPTIANKV